MNDIYTNDYDHDYDYDYDIVIKSDNSDKIFSFKQPYDKKTLEYLENLYRENNINDILKLRYCLPPQLFEDIKETTSHFDVNEWKDYSCGSRVNRTDRYHKYNSQCEYYSDINKDNFENFIEISKNILENNVNTTYKKCIGNKKLLYTFREEKDDCFYTVKYKTIYYYKFE